MAGDGPKVSLIRILIAAIDNAGAVALADAEGATEVQRRHLSEDEVLAVVRDEGGELRRAAEDVERRGDPREAGRLRSLADVTDSYAGNPEQDEM